MDEVFKNNWDVIQNILDTQTIDENILRIEETEKTPFVYIDPVNGTFIIKGKATPENTDAFFRPVIDYARNRLVLAKSVEAHFFIWWHSSSVDKMLLDIFKTLESMYKKNINVSCYWYYDEGDDEILEEGEDFQSIIRMPIQLVQIPEKGSL